MNTFGLYFQYTSFINFKNGHYLLGAYSFVSHRLFTQFNFKMYDLLSVKTFIFDIHNKSVRQYGENNLYASLF